MPLPVRAIKPVHVSRVEVPQTASSELEFISNATLSNVIRQLHSLSKQAADLFDDLSADVTSICSRASTLGMRIDRLSGQMAELNLNEEELLSGDLGVPGYQSSMPAEQQVINRRTIPKAVSELYLNCNSPPPLTNFDVFRDDKKSSMKFYTDPSFFFEQWSQELLMESKTKKAHRKKRPRGNKAKKIREVGKIDYSSQAMGREFVGHYQDPQALQNRTPPRQQPNSQNTVQQPAAHETVGSQQQQHHLRNASSSSNPAQQQFPPNPDNNMSTPSSGGQITPDNYLVPGSQGNSGYNPGYTDMVTNGDLENVQPPPPTPPAPHLESGTLPGRMGTLNQYNFDESSQYAPLPGMGAQQQRAYPPGPSINQYPDPGMSPEDLPPPPAPLDVTSYPGSAPIPPAALIPPPPPPPPPPPMPLITSVGGPGKIAAAPVAVAEASSKEPSSDLLSAIRNGINLRRVEERQERAKPAPSGKECDVQAIFEAVFKRREYLDNSDSDDDDEDDGSSWSGEED